MDWYVDASQRPDASQGHWGGGEHVKGGEARLDDEGKFELEVPIPKEDRDFTYSVVARVTDLARREERGSASVVAYRSAVAVHVYDGCALKVAEV